MRDILITGFPHSGTTILRELVSRCDNAVINRQENFEVETVPKEGDLIRCVKYPYSLDRFYSDEFSDMNVVHIIRNPLWSLSSIKRRVGDIHHNKHTLKDWESSADRYLNIKRGNVICIRYEDLFIDNGLKNLFDKLGLKYGDITKGTKKEITIKEKFHNLYRGNQIQLDFQNMNTPDKVTLTPQEIMTVMKSEQYKKIYR